MRMRFIGRYTNGHNQVTACGITFTGNDQTEVTGADAIRRLSNHPEFQKCDPLDHDGDGKKGGSMPRRTRKKAADK